jgi:hypothetical protein
VGDPPKDNHLSALLRYLDELLAEAERLRLEIGDAVRRRAERPFWPDRRRTSVPHDPERRRP